MWVVFNTIIQKLLFQLSWNYYTECSKDLRENPEKKMLKTGVAIVAVTE